MDTEIKFGYRHKPTNKWVYLEKILSVTTDGIYLPPQGARIHLQDEFHPDILYRARNILEYDLITASMEIGNMLHIKYGRDNFLEFELVKFEITYKVVDDQ